MRERLVAWAKTVRVRAGAEIVTLVGAEGLHGFLRAVRLWKFPVGTKVRVVGLGMSTADVKASGNWPDGFSFHAMGSRFMRWRTKASGTRGRRNWRPAPGLVCASDFWIWLDPEIIAVGLNRPASLFAGKEWEAVDWGAPGSYLVNRRPVAPAAAAPVGWPELETVLWLGEPATLLRGSLVADLLKAWKDGGERGGFEVFASRFARESGAMVRTANLPASGWRML